MTVRDRIRAALNFEPVDRLPAIEWATWWDKTLQRWREEGLPEFSDPVELFRYLNLDPHRQLWISPRARTCPAPAHYGAPLVRSEQEYEQLREHLYPWPPFDQQILARWAEEQARGEVAVWITLEGFFWFSRSLLGIEQQFYAFYDMPGLVKRMHEELLEYNLRVLDFVYEVCVPDFMTFGEDICYKHGPMVSPAIFEEFMAPYYRQLTPKLRERGVVMIVDSDGFVDEIVPWYLGVGVDGFLPIERRAGCDPVRLRERFPELRMIGGFDKNVIELGEEAIREEFERIAPAMRSGGFIASVDHQTPPSVSLEQYRVYVEVLHEYCRKAAPRAGGEGAGG